MPRIYRGLAVQPGQRTIRPNAGSLRDPTHLMPSEILEEIQSPHAEGPSLERGTTIVRPISHSRGESDHVERRTPNDARRHQASRTEPEEDPDG